MPVLLRIVLAVLVAAAATLGIFWLMQTLISSGGSVVEDNGVGKLVEFVDISRDEDVQTKNRKPQKPPAAPKEPPKPDMPKPAASNDSAGGFDIGAVDIGADLSIDAGLGSGGGDGDYLPIVKVAPQYPRHAAQRGIEGYVVLEFTVNEIGQVVEPKVIEADPPNVFNQAAINAALKFKYKPKIVNGKPEAVSGVRNIIRFELDKSSR
ncbi:MAG TPA: energy transducer TonB [Pseudomonadales bacterium]